MSSGRPDYWQTTYTSLPMPVSGQLPVQEEAFADIAASDNEMVLEYTVPAGRTLYVTHIQIHTKSLAICRGNLTLDATFLSRYNLVTNLVVPLNASSFFVITAGHVFGIQVYNDDIKQQRFKTCMLGFELQT